MSATASGTLAGLSTADRIGQLMLYATVGDDPGAVQSLMASKPGGIHCFMGPALGKGHGATRIALEEAEVPPFVSGDPEGGPMSFPFMMPACWASTGRSHRSSTSTRATSALPSGPGRSARTSMPSWQRRMGGTDDDRWVFEPATLSHRMVTGLLRAGFLIACFLASATSPPRPHPGPTAAVRNRSTR